MKVSQKEIESVSVLPAFERYQHFIKRVADFELMYTLSDGKGNFAISDLENNELLSFWPAKEYAELNAIDEWSVYRVHEVSIEDFEDKIIDLVVSENYLLNIFPANGKTGFVVNLEEFARDLSSEMEKYS
jgi:hypothetical protein